MLYTEDSSMCHYVRYSQIGSYILRAGQLSSGFGRLWECWQLNTLVITQALVLCLIYTHSPSSAVRPQASCVYIKQSTLACVMTYTYSSDCNNNSNVPEYLNTAISHSILTIRVTEFEWVRLHYCLINHVNI